jgi:hypothetical protein
VTQGPDGVPDGPLYPWLLGPRYAVLPPLVQQMHQVAPRMIADGAGTVTHGTRIASRLVARVLGFPRAGADRSVRVIFERQGAVETLSRHYEDATLTTHQMAAGPAGSGLLGERFGPLTLVFRLEASDAAIRFVLEDVRCLGVSLPRWLRPRIDAREFVADGWYRFDVRVALPVVGLLIHYDGRLRITESD